MGRKIEKTNGVNNMIDNVAYNNTLIRCVCDSDLVYLSSERDAELINAKGEVFTRKRYRGACTECGRETKVEIGKFDAEASWNRETLMAMETTNEQ